MSNAIKAIETRYQGYRFRSRLEARWAVFLDHLGMKWEYEVEGYNLPSGNYLPDFWLPEIQCWLEIKGVHPSVKELDLCRDLAQMTRYPVAISWGIPTGSYKSYGRWVTDEQPRTFIFYGDYDIFEDESIEYRIEFSKAYLGKTLQAFGCRETLCFCPLHSVDEEKAKRPARFFDPGTDIATFAVMDHFGVSSYVTVREADVARAARFEF